MKYKNLKNRIIVNAVNKNTHRRWNYKKKKNQPVPERPFRRQVPPPACLCRHAVTSDHPRRRHIQHGRRLHLREQHPLSPDKDCSLVSLALFCILKHRIMRCTHKSVHPPDPNHDTPYCVWSSIEQLIGKTYENKTKNKINSYEKSEL